MEVVNKKRALLQTTKGKDESNMEVVKANYSEHKTETIFIKVWISVDLSDYSCEYLSICLINAVKICRFVWLKLWISIDLSD